MAKILFAPLSIAAGLLAGLLGRKLFEGAWGLIDGQQPPEPEQRDVGWPKLLAALVIEGAIFRLVKGLVDHGARQYFERATGAWPGDREPAAE